MVVAITGAREVISGFGTVTASTAAGATFGSSAALLVELLQNVSLPLPASVVSSISAGGILGTAGE